MKALLIDDVKGARKALYHDLIDYCENIEVIGEADSVLSAIPLIKEKKPDLLFLDIELGDGTGFDVLEGLNEIPQVIFTTAFDQYAIKAFKYGALDYLLKPIDEEELQQAVRKAQFKQKSTSKEVLSVLKSTYKNTDKKQTKVVIHSQEECAIIDISEIISCEASSNYTIFHLTDNRQLVSSETLKHYDELFEIHGFFRTHHSHLVNLAKVKSFVKIDGGYLVLENETQIPVSVRKKETLNKMLKERFLS
jgi:two-component system LytT family response regulator